MKRLAFALAVLLALPLIADDEEDALRKDMEKAIGEGAAFRRVGPFLVAGKMPEGDLDDVEGTITRCHKALEKQFFDKDADRLLAVYLFPTADKYDAFCISYMGERSTSKYGFYLPGRHALVMNIGTGTGTLVHEMTHALIEFDFPKVPCWFNEGFASLFEQCSTAGGKIRGLVNWRLPLLQRAIGDKSVLTWKKLCEYTGRDFYGDGSGLRYAEARYLCMWLQEKGLLEGFYEKFRGAQEKDASGYETLAGLFDKPIEEVEAEWREWVAGLKWE